MILPDARALSVGQERLAHTSSGDRVVLLEHTPRPELRPQVLDHVLESTRRSRVAQVEPVDAGLGDPPLQDIRHRLGAADRLGVGPGYRELLQHPGLGPLEPLGARDGGRPGLDHGLDRARARERKVVVVGEVGKVRTRPPAKQRRRPFQVCVLEEVLEFGLGFLVCLVHHDEDAGEEADAVGLSALLNEEGPME